MKRRNFTNCNYNKTCNNSCNPRKKCGTENEGYYDTYDFNSRYMDWYRSYYVYYQAWLANQQGFTSVVGPTASQKLNQPNASNGGNFNNMQLSGISVIANGSTTAIANSEAIPLNALRNGMNGTGTSGANMFFDSINHTITIQRKGNYYVSWGADIDGITAVGTFLELTLVQSYNNTSPITSTSGSNSLHSQIVGNTMITVANTPTVLSLINTSGYAIDLAQVKVQSWMNVIG